MYEIANLWLASVAAQAGLNLTWSETPEDTFSHDGAQTYGKLKHTLKLLMEFRPILFSQLPITRLLI